MENTQRTHQPHPVLLAALVGAGAGMLAGVLLAPGSGTALRQNVQKSAHKYALLASEQEQEVHHHLMQHAHKLERAYKNLISSCHDHLQLWGLLTQDPRRPY
ncbi:YtxH domain-containing protein [Hymenobacter canadensis]|uniref:YtxH domain-containing protein n=1 Tax=Hymenobacter canadensis TaxID=2999067 RepID=A0ABY7LJ23_9BACT|nr:YtxH domain-containing protein [Hymenobacter canadensis]WBA40363.1 YtxH domain-containing protein [Hymenobacter canadensis]